ncbi:unnamed protein product, partial [Polarella glacialis]
PVEMSENGLQLILEVETTLNSATLRWHVVGAAAGAPDDAKACQFVVTISPSRGPQRSTRPQVVLPAASLSEDRFQHTFHFLPCSWTFRAAVTLQEAASSDGALAAASVEATTAAAPGRGPMDWALYLGPEHELGAWVSEAPGDWMWALESRCPYELFRDIWRCGMFALPQRGL